MAQPIISANNLDLFYGSFQALHGINLAFDEHKITA